MPAGPLRLTQIWLYPVKSLAGIPLQTATAGERGLPLDRRFMLLDGDGLFLTQRKAPQMALVQPAIEGDTLVLRHRTRPMPSLRVPLLPPAEPVEQVTVWDDQVESVRMGDDADAWLSAALDRPCRLVALPAGGRRFAAKEPFATLRTRATFADAFPYLLAGQASLDALNARLEQPLDMRRFRPNLVIAGSDAFAEDHWERIRIDGVELRLVKPCGRCAITTVDPDRGVYGKEPLRTLARFRRRPDGKVNFGQNAVAESTGELRVGAAVEVLVERSLEALAG